MIYKIVTQKPFYFFLVFFSLVFSQGVFALGKSGCIDGKIKYIEQSKEVIVNERYCYDSLLHSISTIKKCPDNKECISNLPGPILIKHKEIELCEKANGVSQLIEYWDGEAWIKTKRCIFNDGSFIDLNALKLKIKFID